MANVQERIIKKYDLDPATLQPSHEGGQVKCVGRSKKDGKWYGWSHRAIGGFKSKGAAKRFAKSVS